MLPLRCHAVHLTQASHFQQVLEYYRRRAAAVEAEKSAETEDAAALRAAGWPWA